MKYFDWDKEKNLWLKQERNICFEDITHALDQGKELDRIDHPNRKRYTFLFFKYQIQYRC